MSVTSFDEFRDRVESAKPESFKDSAPALGADGGGEAELGAMKAHILSLYKGVKVVHSFAMPDGDVVDCVAIESQPTLSHTDLKGHTIQLTPPAPEPLPPPVGGVAGPKPEMVDAHLGEGKVDAYGNKMSCPDGTIPMRRVTLEEMARFKTTTEFFQKSPGGGLHPGQLRARRQSRGATPADVHTGHHYGTGAQGVNNNGGASFLNLWSPVPVAGGFSLSQHWYTGGSFTGNTLQTVEGGWQVYPGKYGTATPRLFIYWTANAYVSTGCYNLDCKAFVQTNKTWVLGGALSPVSTPGGTQYQINMQWKRDPGTGNWWLFLQGSGAQTAVGYYPKALYGVGALTQNATEIEYGGEVYGLPTSGQMGSGAFAAQGFGKACYQGQIFYIETAGPSAWADLSGYESDPKCYTETGGMVADSNFYFGGPKCP